MTTGYAIIHACMHAYIHIHVCRADSLNTLIVRALHTARCGSHLNPTRGWEGGGWKDIDGSYLYKIIRPSNHPNPWTMAHKFNSYIYREIFMYILMVRNSISWSIRTVRTVHSILIGASVQRAHLMHLIPDVHVCMYVWMSIPSERLNAGSSYGGIFPSTHTIDFGWQWTHPQYEQQPMWGPFGSWQSSMEGWKALV